MIKNLANLKSSVKHNGTMTMYDDVISNLKAKYSKGPQTGIFTDGSARPNPGPGGWAFAHVVENELVHSNHGSNPDTTNNQMELTALIEGVAYAADLGEEVALYSDSQLCVNTVNQWAVSWEKNGWKRKSGPIKNLELVKELYYSCKENPKVSLVWVPGHSGWLWNEFVDYLAFSPV